MIRLYGTQWPNEVDGVIISHCVLNAFIPPDVWSHRSAEIKKKEIKKENNMNERVNILCFFTFCQCKGKWKVSK